MATAQRLGVASLAQPVACRLLVQGLSEPIPKSRIVLRCLLSPNHYLFHFLMFLRQKEIIKQAEAYTFTSLFRPQKEEQFRILPGGPSIWICQHPSWRNLQEMRFSSQWTSSSPRSTRFLKLIWFGRDQRVIRETWTFRITHWQCTCISTGQMRGYGGPTRFRSTKWHWAESFHSKQLRSIGLLFTWGRAVERVSIANALQLKFQAHLGSWHISGEWQALLSSWSNRKKQDAEDQCGRKSRLWNETDIDSELLYEPSELPAGLSELHGWNWVVWVLITNCDSRTNYSNPLPHAFLLRRVSQRNPKVFSARMNCWLFADGYTTSEVLMKWNFPLAVHGVEQADVPQFTITGFHTEDSIVSTATGSYQRLSLVFQLRRSVGYFIFQTYLPCVLIVMLSWVSFWINHEATSARVALGITTVLTMTTISTGVRQSLPRISYVKSIDIYLVSCRRETHFRI